MSDNYFHVFLTTAFKKHHKTVQAEANVVARAISDKPKRRNKSDRRRQPLFQRKGKR